ncbi:MAG: hypothetical protein F6K09_09970 [Merismopedia sp. SIO2A8]|nr:hypothetical protein [Symploca sp. SIO2B6]NET49033.1 hypothetical protein [Merismopedia sp. SIO2A8]
MTLDRFCVKFFATPDTQVDDEAIFIDIFQDWIKFRKLDGVLLDVADYTHVPDGPGVMLIAYETNYAMDHQDGFGLYAQRKVCEDGTQQEKIMGLVKSTAAFGQLLENDSRVNVTLAGNKFLYISNDRLRGPNTDDGFNAVKGDLEAIAAQLYPGQSVSVTRVDNDPRARLTAVVEAASSVSLSDLAA